jgi:exopolysaccharide biosynthesis predicted pyruvyltransferase EpsI
MQQLIESLTSAKAMTQATQLHTMVIQTTDYTYEGLESVSKIVEDLEAMTCGGNLGSLTEEAFLKAIESYRRKIYEEEDN